MMSLNLPEAGMNLLDRSHAINGEPVDPRITAEPPHGRYGMVHYGLMLPNLPAPYRFLNVILIVGQPKARLFRNSHLITTTARDTVNLLIGTATGTPEQFRGYSIRRDCQLAADGSRLRFGDDLLIEGRYPRFSVRREGQAFNLALELRATDKIAHFARLIGGLYDHWSILCEYEGHIEQGGIHTQVQGLCTYEYARAVDLNLPFRFFSYQILNIDANTQVLFVQVLGPFGLPVQRRVYVRSLDDHGGIYSCGFDFTVQEHEADPVVTPEGTTMRLPRKFSWRVEDEQGEELIAVRGLANGDFKYGLGAGYCGSYGYEGHFRKKPIRGTGYIEYIDQL